MPTEEDDHFVSTHEWLTKIAAGGAKFALFTNTAAAAAMLAHLSNATSSEALYSISSIAEPFYAFFFGVVLCGIATGLAHLAALKLRALSDFRRVNGLLSLRYSRLIGFAICFLAASILALAVGLYLAMGISAAIVA